MLFTLSSSHLLLNRYPLVTGRHMRETPRSVSSNFELLYIYELFTDNTILYYYDSYHRDFDGGHHWFAFSSLFFT